MDGIKSKLIFFSIVAFVVLIPQLHAGPFFIQRSRQFSRREIPNYEYRTSNAKLTSIVISESGAPSISVGISNKIETVRIDQKTFVFNDLAAGPVLISDIAARIGKNDELLVTGTAIHNGGPAGHLKGGKILVRMECLSPTGSRTFKPVIVAVREFECWLQRNEPEAIYLRLICPENKLSLIHDIERIRLVLEYHPNR